MAKNLHLGTLTPNHIFAENNAIQKVYLGNSLIWDVTNPPTITAFSATPSNIDLDTEANRKNTAVTFVKRSTGIYDYAEATIRGQPTDYGSETGFSSLRIAQHYYIGTDGRNGAVPSNVHYYQFSISNDDPNYRKYNAVLINGRTYALTARGSDEVTRGITTHTYWTTADINSADWVTDGRLTINFQFRVSGTGDNIRLSYADTGTSRFVLNLSTGAHTATTTSPVSVARPYQTTRYRLISQNAGGSTQQDTTVTVTQNATISNLRRTGFFQPHDGSGGGNFQFMATVTGTPRPVVSWNMPDGQVGTNNAHTSFQSTGINQWTITIGGLNGLRLSVTSGLLAVTVQNSSNSDTATIANVGN